MIRGRYHGEVHGIAQVDNANKQANVFDAPGEGKTIYITHAVVSVVEAADGGGTVSLIDNASGDVIFTADADSPGVYALTWGDYGYPLSENSALVLQVSGATTDATAHCSVVGYVKRKTLA